MDTLYSSKDADLKPSLNIHCSFVYHHPSLGINFKIDSNDDVHYYDFDDIYDFIFNNRIPTFKKSPSIYTYPLDEDKVEEVLSMNFSILENINNDHHNQLVFSNSAKNRYWTNNSFCKYLFPNLDMRFGAGWKLTGEASLFSDSTDTDFSHLDEKVSLQIQKYLLNPETFISDVNLAIQKKEKEYYYERAHRQNERAIRLENSLVKTSLPTKNDVFFIEHDGRLSLFDKRFIDKYSLDRDSKYVNNLILSLTKDRTSYLIDNNFSDEEILKEFFSSSYLKEWKDYIFEISSNYDLPFYDDDLTSWIDIYSHSSDIKKYLEGLLPSELNKSIESSKKSLFEPVDLSKSLDNDLDYSKHSIIDNLKNDAIFIDIHKAHLETSIDVSNFLDENEIPCDFYTYHKLSDEGSCLYKSNILDFECFVFESMGDKILFIKHSELDDFQQKFSSIKFKKNKHNNKIIKK
jgi:hypothetical protein